MEVDINNGDKISKNGDVRKERNRRKPAKLRDFEDYDFGATPGTVRGIKELMNALKAHEKHPKMTYFEENMQRLQELYRNEGGEFYKWNFNEIPKTSEEAEIFINALEKFKTHPDMTEFDEKLDGLWKLFYKLEKKEIANMPTITSKDWVLHHKGGDTKEDRARAFEIDNRYREYEARKHKLNDRIKDVWGVRKEAEQKQKQLEDANLSKKEQEKQNPDLKVIRKTHMRLLATKSVLARKINYPVKPESVLPGNKWMSSAFWGKRLSNPSYTHAFVAQSQLAGPGEILSKAALTRRKKKMHINYWGNKIMRKEDIKAMPAKEFADFDENRRRLKEQRQFIVDGYNNAYKKRLLEGVANGNAVSLNTVLSIRRKDGRRRAKAGDKDMWEGGVKK